MEVILLNKALTRIKDSKGYVSIETIVVAGLVIGVGVVAYMAFQTKGNVLLENSINKVEEANNSAVVNNPF